MRTLLTRLAPEVNKAVRLVPRRTYAMGLTTEELRAIPREERVKKNMIDMDSLPQPYGNWATEHAAAQSKYNLHLIVSLSLFVASLFLMNTRWPVVLPDLYAPVNVEEEIARRKAEAS